MFGVMFGFWGVFAVVLRRFDLPFPTPAVFALAVVTAGLLTWLLFPLWLG